MLKKIFRILVLVISVFILREEVFAVSGELTIWSQDDIYYVMRDYNGFYQSYSFPFYAIDNVTVYCIEPGVVINTNRYVGETGFNYSPFSDEVNTKLNLIGYYGYDYMGHDTLRYRMATQALIWELTGNKIIEYYTKRYGYGDYIDVTYEKNVIMNLVNNHFDLPSFNGEYYEVNIGDTLIIEDKNNVLNKLDVLSSGGNDVRIEGNKIYITVKKYGEVKIELGSYKYDDEDTVIFVGSGIDSQMMGRFRLKNIVHSSFNVKGVGNKIKIKKIDKDTKEEIKISNIMFKIRNDSSYICENDDCIFYTDDNGEVITNNYYNGKYYVIELEDNEIDGYTWNSDTIEVDTTLCIDNLCSIEFPNKRVRGKIIITKYGESVRVSDNIYYDSVKLEGVKYELYAGNDIKIGNTTLYYKDDLIDSYVTDSDGIIVIDNLEIGNYYLKEVSSSLGNIVSNDKYYFDIEYNGKYEEEVTKEITLYNYLPKGSVNIKKVDEDDNRLDSTLFGIYYKKDGEYSLIYKCITDSDGIISVDNMPYGDYYIYEIGSKEGYVKDDKKIYFKIDEEENNIEIVIENKKYIEVPNTLKFENVNIRYLGIFNIIFGIGAWYIGKKIF